jgi:tRNA dimethylallyltransferase
MKNSNSFKQFAIIGSTASGKTSLAIACAKKRNAHILSIDSLSIYKEVDIVSAKPSVKEQDNIKHYGIDLLTIPQHFDVGIFIKLYQEVYLTCLKEKKNLIIVGGTGFYLKMLIDGISTLPPISQNTYTLAKQHLLDVQETYTLLHTIDPDYMQSISQNDTYRIEKALLIYLETSMTPSQYFYAHPPKSIITNPLPIYQITWERETLRKRIALRTKLMVKEGLIDEICRLEKTYGRAYNAMKSIGIKETLLFLDGVYDKKMLIEKITINTARLAKRQNTFNNSQFKNVIKGDLETLEALLL